MEKKDFQLLCRGLGRINDGEEHLAIQPTDVYEPNDLVYLRNRYYNPELGQFISQDPLEGNSCNPMSLNRYAYVNDNPVNYTDPSGLFGCLPALDVVFAQVPTPTPNPTATPIPPCSLVSELMNDLGVSEDAAKGYITDLLAGVAYQQNSVLGYEAMVLTMAATMNSIDAVGHGSVTRQLQQSQSVFSYTKSSNCSPETQANIDQYNRCSKPSLYPNEPAEKCAAVQTAEAVIGMLGCLHNYQTLIDDPVKTAANNLVNGRCASGQASALFSGTLAIRIQAIDNDNNMRYVYSFDDSWSGDFDKWKQCQQIKNPEQKAEFLGTGAGRAGMITNVFNGICGNWKQEKSPDNTPDYVNHCCGATLASTPTPTPSP